MISRLLERVPQGRDYSGNREEFEIRFADVTILDVTIHACHETS